MFACLDQISDKSLYNYFRKPNEISLKVIKCLVVACRHRRSHSGPVPSLVLALWWWASHLPSLSPSFLVYQTENNSTHPRFVVNIRWCDNVPGVHIPGKNRGAGPLARGSMQGVRKWTALREGAGARRHGGVHTSQSSGVSAVTPLSLQDGAKSFSLSSLSLFPTDDPSSHIFRNWIFWLLCCEGRFDEAYGSYVLINWHLFPTGMCWVSTSAVLKADVLTFHPPLRNHFSVG